MNHFLRKHSRATLHKKSPSLLLTCASYQHNDQINQHVSTNNYSLTGIFISLCSRCLVIFKLRISTKNELFHKILIQDSVIPFICKKTTLIGINHAMFEYNKQRHNNHMHKDIREYVSYKRYDN